MKLCMKTIFSLSGFLLFNPKTFKVLFLLSLFPYIPIDVP